MFKNLSIKTRLIFVIVFLGIELIVGAAVGLVGLGRANGEMQSLYDDRLVCLGQLDLIVRKLNRNQLDLAEAVTAAPEAIPALLADVDNNIKVISETWKAYMATSLTADEASTAARFAEARKRFIDDGLLPVAAAVRAGDMAAATALVHGKMTSTFVPVRQEINRLIQIQLDEAKRETVSSRDTYELIRLACLAGLGLGLVLAAVLGTLLVRGIVNPLAAAVKVAGGVAAGDLTQHIDVRSNDETGQLMRALKNMNDALVKIVGEVRGGTDTITTASGQIAVGNLDLSARTEQQASSLEETASSMEELTSTVKQNADNARQANALAVSASEVADRGGKVVSQVVDTMGAINASARRIVDIISVIDGIAFQTNILALNAAVEAARAGEQGRGFAVVASEVRNLAQRSAAAAKEIKSLIDDSVNKVQHGSTLVDQAGATMVEVVQSVGRVTDIMAEITAASAEQTTGIEQVNEAIAQMDQVTQQNAALVEEASAAAQSMQEQAEGLARAVGIFRLDARPAEAETGAAPRIEPRTAAAAPARPAASAARPAPRRLASRTPVAAADEWEEF